MHRLGFGQKWRNILSLLWSSSSSRVMVNGELGQSFLHRRGRSGRETHCRPCYSPSPSPHFTGCFEKACSAQWVLFPLCSSLPPSSGLVCMPMIRLFSSRLYVRY
ncbi:hypothetical protein VPH35_111315 [Triticum aestivum]